MAKMEFTFSDKYVETVERNEKLYAALLKEKDEKIALLEKILAEKKNRPVFKTI